MSKFSALPLLGLIVLLSGCATTFRGDAKVPHGPRGCQNICSRWGMKLTGMVALGEYTDGCICSVPGQQASNEDITRAVTWAGASGGGAAGVSMQMAEQERSANKKR